MGAEAAFNKTLLADRLFNEPNDAKLAEHAILPRLHTSAASAAIASGRFSGPMDSGLFREMFYFQDWAESQQTAASPREYQHCGGRRRQS
jgi:hypothetical protein